MAAKRKRDPKSVELANKIIEQYQPESVQNIAKCTESIFGPMFKAILEGDESSSRLRIE